MDANIAITLTIDSGLLVSDIELQIVAAMIFNQLASSYVCLWPLIYSYSDTKAYDPVSGLF